MGFDLYLTPPVNFFAWDEEQWDAYWRSALAAEGEKLGNSTYVGLSIECITHNLEADRPGSVFPLLMRLDSGDPPGWSREELPELLEEIGTVRARLAALPISRSTLIYDNDEVVRRRVAGFEKHNGRRPTTLYDLCERFLVTFEQMARRAAETGHGLVASF
jgi:hypothetical protein